MTILKPPRLRRGDVIGLISPASTPLPTEKIEKGIRYLEGLGYRIKLGKHVAAQHGYFAGADEERLSDLNTMLNDSRVNAIFAIRGGYGSPRLLPFVDYGAVRRQPKIVVGFSDITALHLAIHKKTGLITFHGPVVLSRFTGYTQEHFHAALFDTKPIGAIANPPDSNPLRPAHALRTVRPGKARGRLIGGNLSLICSLMGTPYEIDTRGRILFTEDVDEEPYRIDRMLTQLRLAGKLDAAAGIVFGECADCRPKDYKASFNSTFTLGEVLDRMLGDLKIPVLSGLTIGHTEDQLTLPEGAMATLDADKQELILEEAAVVA